MLRFSYYALMICFPNCKINIGLYITNKRADNFHDLETVFYPVTKLHDALEVTPSEDNTSRIHLRGAAIDGRKEENLVWKAYELLKGQFPAQIPAIDIHLLKNIPMGAGLGGGSADGAFMLKLLNDYCKLGLRNKTLAEMALKLGSDCPFFIYNIPQYAMGRGERMTPSDVDLSEYSIQVICPDIKVSTAKAFSMITPRKPLFNLQKLPELPVQQWKDHITNDFEDVIFSLHPELSHIKRNLYEQGAIYAAMSGSGSALYGIFEKGVRAEVTPSIPFKEFYYPLS